MYGIALEGGGAKGAYHMGAIKALKELGYEFDAIVGTSIGAFNAAVIAQGDFEKLYERWWESTTAIGLDVSELEFNKVLSKKLDLGSIKYWTGYISQGISNKGIDISKLRKLYESFLDEEKLRKSDIKYGMVTVSRSDRKPIYVYKEDIPEGSLVDYVLASSYLPMFRKEKLLDDKFYIDGGFYDNCPVSLLVNKGYKDIIEIRTGAIGLKKKIDRKNLNVLLISPSKDTGKTIFGANRTIRNNINMGYYDTLRTVKGYIGKKYYVAPCENDKVFKMLTNLTDEQITKILSKSKLVLDIEKNEPKKMLFEKLMPMMASRLRKEDTSSYQTTIVSFIESLVDDDTMPVYKLYTFDEFIAEFKRHIPKLLKKEKGAIIKNRVNEAAMLMIKELEI